VTSHPVYVARPIPYQRSESTRTQVSTPERLIYAFRETISTTDVSAFFSSCNAGFRSRCQNERVHWNDWLTPHADGHGRSRPQTDRWPSDLTLLTGICFLLENDNDLPTCSLVPKSAVFHLAGQP